MDVDYPYGWAKLVIPLIDRCAEEGVPILQIKEKFGGLRFYVGAASNELFEAINNAEEASFKICQECGEPGTTKSINGWLATLCDKHSTVTTTE